MREIMLVVLVAAAAVVMSEARGWITEYSVAADQQHRDAKYQRESEAWRDQYGID